MDPDLQKQFDAINANLVDIKTKKGQGIWQAFFNGMFGALGYVVGVAMIVLILGWYLNKTGTLPEFQKQIQNFQSFMTQAQKLMGAGQGSGQR